MKNLNVRMPDDLHVSLKALAEEEHRSLNSEILDMLEAAVRDRQQQRSSKSAHRDSEGGP